MLVAAFEVHAGKSNFLSSPQEVTPNNAGGAGTKRDSKQRNSTCAGRCPQGTCRQVVRSLGIARGDHQTTLEEQGQHRDSKREKQYLCWSLPSRYMSAGYSRPSVACATPAHEEPESNQTSIVSVPLMYLSASCLRPSGSSSATWTHKQDLLTRDPVDLRPLDPRLDRWIWFGDQQDNRGIFKGSITLHETTED